ncbi:MAG: mannose-6-phosphate isomerase, partial [Lacunisphaera sp.]
NSSPAPHLLRSEKPSEVLVRSREFTLRRERLKAGGQLAFAAGEQARVLSVVEGTLVDEKNPGQSVGFGDNVLLPYGGSFSFVAKEATIALVTEDFSK